MGCGSSTTSASDDVADHDSLAWTRRPISRAAPTTPAAAATSNHNPFAAPPSSTAYATNTGSFRGAVEHSSVATITALVMADVASPTQEASSPPPRRARSRPTATPPPCDAVAHASQFVFL
eukprot:CAMPEP_0174855516 /NCGR_PEP_ID=MMETSP1114-20130205/33452_1 /TAXON_ID=312471 /ORGANISM="Neobodo designis, Strain CCAP 1951/1" /LENGTH=120 /DNA_ID=CAMNT_0016090257 /DNA_START=21 /DNA_END=383 /DNA_ORIENTATION=+